MTDSHILVPAMRCSNSPTNVRKARDAQGDAQLEASIEKHGILQNLLALPKARKRGHYSIIGGGRRLDCVHALIAKGVLPADYAVPLKVATTPNDAIELSLAENFFRAELSPADACRAFQDIIEVERKTPADIAKRFGITERFVLGRLRLANLAEPIFEALREGEITLDIAMAYASTSDTARQQVVFEALKDSYAGDNPAQIRRDLASYGLRGNDPRALLVGREAYLAAGGRIDADLFSDSGSENWLDADLVEHMAREKLSSAAEALRVEQGVAEIRPVIATHVPWLATDGMTRLVGTPASLTPEQEARRCELEAAIAEAEAYADDEMSDEEQTHLDGLIEEFANIVEREPIVTAEQRANAIVHLVIGPDGTPHLDRTLYLAQEDSEEPDANPGESGESDDGGEPVAKPAMSQRLADELAMMKTELIALHVASDPHFALDLGTFFMVDAATQTYGSWAMPSQLRAAAPTPRVHNFESATPAADEWTKLQAGLDRGWTQADDIIGRYDAYCALSDEARAAWLGWAIARTLDAVPRGKNGSAFLDHVASKLGIDVARWWRPTARNYFDRISKAVILDTFAEVGGAELRSRYGASKKHDLAAAAERLFAGQTIVEAEVKERALRWLPPAMQFGINLEAGHTEPDDTADQLTDLADAIAGVTPEAPADDPAGPDREAVDEAA
jgi:ParB family chromosome partitioning protein